MNLYNYININPSRDAVLGAITTNSVVFHNFTFFHATQLGVNIFLHTQNMVNNNRKVRYLPVIKET